MLPLLPLLTAVQGIASVAVKSKTAYAAHAAVGATSPLWLPLVEPALNGDGAAIAQLGGIVGTWLATLIFRWRTEKKIKKG